MTREFPVASAVSASCMAWLRLVVLTGGCLKCADGFGLFCVPRGGLYDSDGVSGVLLRQTAGLQSPKLG